ncbi:ABC transporter ATP-binding protein [Alteromonas sp. KC3]|uniref:ABC transporter ATP-binding protein n=1 Tax=unclassified Alteromonas TaxID=2614992 RepID=UPI00192236CA|nr:MULTISPECIES: ABC transporter ATP-binding protein [unclassified Alteromonas]BCO17280.1 ABC transporter ATP-binding protein [Alteromonas sp. KC3]BCO21269.1 ABC transporter ATP-binding protein [Alteromonas sp. KC14]
MLSVSNLSVNYGSTRVVDKLNVELGQDEILMLVGPTGCGKTTILQALAGLIPISEGSMRLGSWESTANKHVPPEKRNVGMVFQDFALFPHLTVQQNVCFRLKDTALADHWLNLLGLDAFRDAKPARLSGGQKQRVALARTLAHEPAFVLLDEPLSNLDAALKDSLRWEIRDALKKAGVPAIWVTHDQDEALSVGDRVGILNKGVLEQLDTPEACYSMPASRFVARFMGEASFLKATFNNSANNPDNVVITDIGNVPGTPLQGANGNVDLLVRPDDLSLSATHPQPNGIVDWVRYEGESRLYAVTLDNGSQLKVRVSHENAIKPGTRAHMALITTHPLAVFPRD